MVARDEYQYERRSLSFMLGALTFALGATALIVGYDESNTYNTIQRKAITEPETRGKNTYYLNNSSEDTSPSQRK